jgi:hypothetical protein
MRSEVQPDPLHLQENSSRLEVPGGHSQNHPDNNHRDQPREQEPPTKRRDVVAEIVPLGSSNGARH